MKRNIRIKDMLILVYILISLIVVTFGVRIISVDNYRIQILRNDSYEFQNQLNTSFKVSIDNYIYEGESIEGGSFLLTKDKRKVILSEIVNTSDKLFIYIQTESCHVCFSKLMHEIEMIKSHINMDDVIFFGSFRDSKDITILNNEYPFLGEIYNIEGSSFNHRLTEVDKPVLFVLDKAMNMKCIYIADKIISSKMTIPYFQAIGKRFFEWDLKNHKTKKEHQCSDPNCQHNHQ